MATVINESMFPDLISCYNKEGKTAAYNYLRTQFGLKHPEMVFPELRNPVNSSLILRPGSFLRQNSFPMKTLCSSVWTLFAIQPAKPLFRRSKIHSQRRDLLRWKNSSTSSSGTGFWLSAIIFPWIPLTALYSSTSPRCRLMDTAS